MDHLARFYIRGIHIGEKFLRHQYCAAKNLLANRTYFQKRTTCFYLIAHTVGWILGWSDFEFFWNFKNRHLSMDSGFNSKTKIEKAFFDILTNHRVLCYGCLEIGNTVSLVTVW